jgi:PPOX class probable F420-dependent enzyme
LKLSETSIKRFIDTWPVARLATLNGEGRPHQVPVVFVHYEGILWSPVDGKPKRAAELARIANAIANPSASLLLDHYADDWSQLWWLRIDVELQVHRLNMDDGNPLATATAGAVEALRRKYAQYEGIPVLRDPPTLLCMQPLNISSWCATPC